MHDGDMSEDTNTGGEAQNARVHSMWFAFARDGTPMFAIRTDVATDKEAQNIARGMPVRLCVLESAE